MNLIGAHRTKFVRRALLDRGAKSLRKPGRFEPRERQMRRKRSLFAGDAEYFHRLFDRDGAYFQIRRSLDARPQAPRMFFAREEAEAPKFQCHGLIGPHADKRASKGAKLRFRNFANEFER